MNEKKVGRDGNRRGRPPCKPRFEMVWRNKFLAMDAGTIGEMADALRGSAASLREMADAGVELLPGTAGGDYATLVTNDKQVAERFGFAPVEDDGDEE